MVWEPGVTPALPHSATDLFLGWAGNYNPVTFPNFAIQKLFVDQDWLPERGMTIPSFPLAVTYRLIPAPPIELVSCMPCRGGKSAASVNYESPSPIANPTLQGNCIISNNSMT